MLFSGRLEWEGIGIRGCLGSAVNTYAETHTRECHVHPSMFYGACMHTYASIHRERGGKAGLYQFHRTCTSASVVVSGSKLGSRPVRVCVWGEKGVVRVAATLSVHTHLPASTSKSHAYTHTHPPAAAAMPMTNSSTTGSAIAANCAVRKKPTRMCVSVWV